MLTYAGYRVVIRHPTPMKPRWYDFPRLLGWRPRKFTYLIDKGQYWIDKPNRVLYVRQDDYPEFERAVRQVTAEASA